MEKIIVNPSAYLNYLLMILKEIQLITKYKINSQGIKNTLKVLKSSNETIEIRDLISFIREINNNPRFYIAERFIKKGYLIVDINVEFDEKGT